MHLEANLLEEQTKFGSLTYWSRCFSGVDQYQSTASPTKYLMPFLCFSDNLLQDDHTIFQKRFINFL